MVQRFGVFCLTVFVWLAATVASWGEGLAPLSRDEISPYIVPPYALGDQLNDKGVYELLNSGEAPMGYVFETGPLAPLPGFSGAPLNMLVLLSETGQFLDVKLLSQREPVFVSGLGEEPLLAFLQQYNGHAITESLVVGVPYGSGGSGSDLVYLDGVSKATASVRIAHESILAATLSVAREKMQGLGSGSPARPDLDYEETLTWSDLVEQGIAQNLRVTNAEVDQAFAGTKWADDDPEAAADPDGLYLDLWLVDLGPPSIAKAVLSEESYADLARFLEVSPEAEPLLVIDDGRHGLVSEDFVRNTAPDRLSAEQGGLPVALRDADLWVELADDLPDAQVAMVLRADRRLGFDPVSEWVLRVQAVREHGMFQPELGEAHFELTTSAPARFFIQPEVIKPMPAWLEAIYNRQADIIVLSVFLIGLLVVLSVFMRKLAGHRHFSAMRLSILAFVIVFVGWWGQGQLSIVTVLATLRAAAGNGSFAVLLYDPFSLVLWGVAILGFLLWGRGLFCGWLCPFGAMQEFMHHLGRLLRLPQIRVSARTDFWLMKLKYVLLLGLIGVAFIAPDYAEKAAEIEPFKTAITVYFVREWYYVAYAVFWLLLGTVFFKGFCRYVCPLGAVMAIGGVLRGRKWIDRREACGSPCQLCRVKCRYGAIRKSGAIQYDECFACLDCVQIYDDPQQCVPLILAAKKNKGATV
ncbi:4Fe-4S binding protein [Celeribacter litoreus]|uniref:4Fe-4S binding protein n=1 Tax=Celeribacter litoreus TaxID=2876714 RepID=UPI001CCAAB9C|nr:4Fe-4S binding protein [Celeribacter litoreus]MCA0044432.1 4Fe-4S binding protein [Celeribacter litoreus]